MIKRQATRSATHQAVCRAGAAVTRTITLDRSLAATDSKAPFFMERPSLLQDFNVVGITQANGAQFCLVRPSTSARDQVSELKNPWSRGIERDNPGDGLETPVVQSRFVDHLHERRMGVLLARVGEDLDVPDRIDDPV